MRNINPFNTAEGDDAKLFLIPFTPDQRLLYYMFVFHKELKIPASK
jgi:hypothetical protein